MFDDYEVLRIYARAARDAVVSAADGWVPAICAIRADGGSDLEDSLIVHLQGADRKIAADLLVDLVFMASASPDDWNVAIRETIVGSGEIHPLSMSCH